MYKLNDESKAYIKSATGLSYESILDMSSEEVDAEIEKAINKKLEHKESLLFKLSSRGTPFLYLWRLVTLKGVDDKLSKIIR